MSGRKTSSETAVGWIFARQRKRLRATQRHQNLEALIAGQDHTARAHSAGRPRRSARLHRPAADCRGRPESSRSDAPTLPATGIATGEADDGDLRCQRCTSRGRTNIGLRQVQRERAALARSAAQLDFAAQQAGQFAADRQTQSGSAVLAAGAGVCLLERLEDDSLFFDGNADAGVGNLEGHHRGGLAENRMVLAPAALGHRHGQAHAP